MPNRTIDVLWRCITTIEAQDQLKLLNALDWPNMKKAQRLKLHKDLFRQAFPSSLKPKNVITTQDLQRILSNGR
jgi:hypothetical protein